MRLESLRLKGLGPFRDEVAVDLRELDGKTIAIVGENGAGKSTLVECALPGALYRSTPTRGALTSLATERGAYLEARVVNGTAWTIRHTVDAVSGKGEALVLDEQGAPVLESTSVRKFDEWAAKHLPPESVLFSSVFAPQGAAGFLGMTRGDRKAVLLRVLGIERFEAYAAIDREHAKAERTRLQVLGARLADERERGGDVEALAGVIEANRAELVELDGRLRKLRAELDEGRQANERARAQRAAEEERCTKARALDERIAAERRRLGDLEERLRNNRAVLADAAAIRAAVVSLELARQNLADLEAARSALATEAAVLLRTLTDLERQQAEADARLGRVRTRVRDAEIVRAAAAQFEECREQREAAARELADVEVAYEALRGKRLAGAEERIGELRAGLAQIAGAGDDAEVDELRSLADTTIDRDDVVAAEALEAPARAAELAEAVTLARRTLEQSERELRRIEALAGRLAEVEVAEAEERVAAAEVADLAARLDAARAAEREARVRAAELGERVAGQRAAVGKLDAAAARSEPLARAEARIAELEPQRVAVAQELERLVADREALGPVGGEAVFVLEFDVAATERAIAEAERRYREAVAALATAEQRLEQARAAAARVAELEAERATVEAELADWNRLAEDLGRDGLQAMLIDAAGPELTTITNDLLHSCHGPRFTVRIETQRASSDGKKTIEGCDVIVLDTQNGREAEGSTFSGGEKVILGEALSLALSVLACRTAGVTSPTLVRDESGAALDPKNARVYFAMLRRAQALIGAAHVLFISHTPELWDLADARLRIADGRVSLDVS